MTRPERRRADGEETRRRILEATVAILGREGPTGLRAAALAREVGVSKATLFHHFPTLKEIPLAALDAMSEEVLDWTPPKGAKVADLLAMLEARTFELVRQRPDLLRAQLAFFGEAMFDAELRARLAAALERAVGTLADHFEAVGIERADTHRYARMAVALLDGLALQLLGTDADEDEARATWAAFARLLAGAKPERKRRTR